tara:strand:+ start:1285 stop:1932 length:648 start_codon:yes stop_codon:yes gene_type:complete
MSIQYKLFMADMDSTIVAQETLDEMAALAGFGDKVKEITKRAMEGHLDFKAALAERVALLEGCSVDLLQATKDQMTLNGGAACVVSALKSAGVKTVLISGGFTFFTQHIADLCGFDAHYGNQLEVLGERLTGRVIPPVIDAEYKRATMLRECEMLGIEPSKAIAIGDGANDKFMLDMAGLAIGYHPKEALRPYCDHVMDGDLDLSALLPLLGLPQ